MTAMELCFTTLADAARRIAGHELSPVELTEAYLQRIGEFDDQLQSFVTLTADVAVRQAAAAEVEIMRKGPRSPLHGIPYCLKDIVETAGIRTTGQSKLLADHVPSQDAVVAAKLQATGANDRNKSSRTTPWTQKLMAPLFCRSIGSESLTLH